MGRAKQINIKVINSKTANEFVKKYHYSGTVVQNSKLHFGAFLDGKLHGVLSYGSPLDKRRVLPLVKTSNKTINEKWNEMLELNRMAFDDYLPRNSESRCIAISIRMIKNQAPHIKWILSFADGTQCGDGTIYRASGFSLTQININKTIWEAPNGEVATDLSLRLRLKSAKQVIVPSITAHKTTENKGASSMKIFKDAGYKPKEGYQLRYIYLIDKSCELSVPEIPFTKIDEIGAGMYKGNKLSLQERRE